MRGRGPIIVLAAVAVLIAFLARGRDDDGGGRPATGPSAGGTAPSGPLLRVAFVHSPEKAAMLEPLIARYNAERHRAGGATVQIVGRNLSSGQATDDIGAGRLKPALWSPASSLWGRLLNYTADRRYAPERSPSLVSTPLVVAMWEPMARALGWPAQRVGFEQLLRLATSRRGWAAYGHREFGPFKLGHTNPDFSTAGLSAVAAEYYAARGKREGLTVADVERPAVRDRIRRIERSIVHYGDTTLFFSDQLRRYGTAYASAVAMEETTLLEFNRRRPRRPRVRSRGGCARTSRPRSPRAAASAPATPMCPCRRRSGARTARTPPSPRACCRCPSRRCSTASAAPGARTASPRTSCSSSTRPARCRRRTGCRRPSAGCARSCGCCRRTTGWGSSASPPRCAGSSRSGPSGGRGPRWRGRSTACFPTGIPPSMTRPTGASRR